MKALGGALLGILIFIALVAFLLALMFLGANWHVSAVDTDSIHRMMAYDLLRGTGISWLQNVPRISHYPELGFVDAIVNAFALFTAVLPIIPFGLVGCAALAIYGLYKGDWAKFLEGLFSIPLFLLAAALQSFWVWLSFFLGFIGPQYGLITPAYAIVWLVLGLPALLAAFAGGAGSTVAVIIIKR